MKGRILGAGLYEFLFIEKVPIDMYMTYISVKDNGTGNTVSAAYAMGLQKEAEQCQLLLSGYSSVREQASGVVWWQSSPRVDVLALNTMWKGTGNWVYTTYVNTKVQNFVPTSLKAFLVSQSEHLQVRKYLEGRGVHNKMHRDYY